MLKFSKRLHIIIFICFFLPFVRGCSFGPSAEEKGRAEKKIADSTALYDTLSRFSLSIETNVSPNNLPDSVATEIQTEEPLYKTIISALLFPSENYSGIFLLTGFSDIQLLTSIIPSFILLVLSLIFIFQKTRKSHKAEFIFSIFQMVFFLLFLFCFHKDVLYGYWIAFFFIIINTCVLFIIVKKSTK